MVSLMKPVHQHLALVGLGVGAVPDAAQGEGPGAGVDGAAQGNLVAELPAELVGQLAAHHRTLAIAVEGQLLRIRDAVLGVQRQVADRVDRKLRKEVALGDVDAAKPVGPAHLLYAFHCAQALAIVQRQGEGQRDVAAGDQPRAAAAFHARVPGVHDGAQQAEGADGHHQAHHGQAGAQLVAEGVLQ